MFVSGEGCDTVFGGLSALSYLSPRFRLLQFLSRLPDRCRFWLRRGLCDFPSTCHEINQVIDGSQRANIGAGILERGAIHFDVQSFRYPVIVLKHWRNTCREVRRVTAALHHCFLSRRIFGGRLVYPFAHPRILRLGIHMPYYLKRRRGKNKWLWRKIAVSARTPPAEWPSRIDRALAKGADDSQWD